MRGVTASKSLGVTADSASDRAFEAVIILAVWITP